MDPPVSNPIPAVGSIVTDIFIVSFCLSLYSFIRPRPLPFISIPHPDVLLSCWQRHYYTRKWNKWQFWCAILKNRTVNTHNRILPLCIYQIIMPAFFLCFQVSKHAMFTEVRIRTTDDPVCWYEVSWPLTSAVTILLCQHLLFYTTPFVLLGVTRIWLLAIQTQYVLLM